jgi:hypothetical protein
MAGGNSYRPRWLAHDEADLAVLLPLVPGTAWPSCNTATQPFPVESAPDRAGTKGSVRGEGRQGEQERSLHVDEGLLLLLAGGDGDLLEPHDGRDLGSHAGEDGAAAEIERGRDSRGAAARRLTCRGLQGLI